MVQVCESATIGDEHGLSGRPHIHLGMAVLSPLQQGEHCIIGCWTIDTQSPPAQKGGMYPSASRNCSRRARPKGTAPIFSSPICESPSPGDVVFRACATSGRMSRTAVRNFRTMERRARANTRRRPGETPEGTFGAPPQPEEINKACEVDQIQDLA